jgi:hypothetical protein
MSCMIVYCFNERESAEMVCLRIRRGRLRGGGVGIRGNSNRVLDKPFIDSFGWVCHEHPAPEICLREHVGEGSRMVYMETVALSVFAQYTRISLSTASVKSYWGSGHA